MNLLSGFDKHHSSATLRLLTGAVFISFSAVFVRLLSVPPTVSAFYRLLFGGGFLLLYVLVTKRSLFKGLTGLLAIVLAAAFFAADLWTWHRSIIYVGPGLATMLASFQVFFLALAGVLFFGERLRWQLMVGVPLALTGLGMIVGFDWQSLSEQYRTGIWLGLLTAVFYASYILSLRRTRTDGKQRSAVADLALVSLISAALLGVVTTTSGDSMALSWPGEIGILLAYALVAQVLGWLLIAHSLNQVPASRVGLILLLQPLLAFVWDVLFFSRSITPVELAGAILTLLGIYLGMKKTARAD
ncbi:MAG: DMT family transporter [Gammaproteobacteria bacterium]|nr:DMT family transporter [Gammaproteobacteria bacterium]